MSIKLMTLVAALLATTPVPESPDADVSWETSLDAAKARAVREGRPILVLDMFGRLDEELC